MQRPSSSPHQSVSHSTNTFWIGNTNEEQVRKENITTKQHQQWIIKHWTCCSITINRKYSTVTNMWKHVDKLTPIELKIQILKGLGLIIAYSAAPWSRIQDKKTPNLAEQAVKTNNDSWLGSQIRCKKLTMLWKMAIKSVISLCLKVWKTTSQFLNRYNSDISYPGKCGTYTLRFHYLLHLMRIRELGWQ